ncbi:amino acid adenylation domain-containing protein [Pseudanabaena sp. UWO310]|nr:amino acid adenylation domain-containing protein [Pseudanabaena sp. UWO310]
MMNDLSKRIAALSPEQQALLKWRMSLKPNPLPLSQSIPQRQEKEGKGHLEVSFGQQRMWFQDRLSLNSAVSNNISIALKIKGNLQVTALAQSLQAILQRHEILRTTYQTIAGELTQIINPIDDWQLIITDLRSLSTEAKEREVENITQSQACQPFNLERDILLRADLLQLSTTEYMLLLTLHHIAVDAWSIGIFFRELSRLYAALSIGNSSPLASLPIQYADFAIWQRQYLQGAVLEKDLNYWKQQLLHAPDLLSLPSDRPRPAVQSFTGKTLSFTIPKDLTAALRDLSQQTGNTLFITLLAALQTLLFRYSGQEDILIGAPIANRQQPELENLIGCFINTLVLRTDLSANPSFLTLMQRVRETVLGALAHQTLPFEKLVDELQLARNLSYAPLFQVMLVFQNAFSIENIELPNLQVEHERIDNHTSQFDFTIHLVEADGLIGKLEYNTDLFDEATITRMLAHFQTLLAGIVTNPDRSLSALPLLPLEEEQQLLAWSQAQTTPVTNACIHQLFEAQVQRTPDAIAAIAGDRQITYQELNQRANQLARYLQHLGVKSESLVGLYVERSIDMLVGLFGILKAGGAYVPIDPNYPSQRLEFILSDAKVSVLLTQRTLIEKIPQFIDSVTAPVILIDGDWEKIASASRDNLELGSVQSDHLAYIIYTSGSTGQPKGVMVEHHSLVNYTEAAIAEYGISDRDHVLQFASIGFDAAAEEIFPCLSTGATLSLRSEEMLGAIASFLQTCADWQISVLDLPTAFWHQMMTEMTDRQLTLPDTIRLVILGGEKALSDRFALWQKIVKPHVRLVNSYGPTEATIVTTTVDLATLDLAGREIPIGKPVRNARTYILDPCLQPTPIGIAGELYIGGMGLARGYLHRPDLTEAKFIPDRFSPAGARLYQTGDRARYWADGTIEFLGRFDRQVKIRGYRIELGEIEALLAQHPEVQESLAIDWEDHTGDKRLVAYVVPKVGDRPTAASLRRFLEKRLPKYMIPAGFMLLSAMPLNKNGKVDRSQLPDPELSRPELTETFIAPRNARESQIAQIFAEILQIERIGIHDDFFELGGHSLLATKLIAQLLSAFPSNLTIIDLFQSPTVAGLADRIEQSQIASPDLLQRSEKSPITITELQSQRPLDLPIPLSFSQQYIWEAHQSSSTGATLNSSIILRMKEAVDPAVVERSFNELIQRHEILRTGFKIVDSQPMQFVLPSMHLPLVYRDLQHLAPTERESEAFNLAIAIAEPAFDLAIAPLIRTTLFRLAPQEHWLSISMHHLITDGASFSLLLQELHSLIQAFSRDLPSPLPAVALQYADFAFWQHRVYNEAAIAQELQYWQHKLVSELVSDRNSLPLTQPLTSREARHYFAEIPTSLVEAIVALSRSLGVTSFAVFLAGLKLTLAAWQGQQEVSILTTVGNRPLPETEQMLGCFINDVILRSPILPEQTGSIFIKQLQTNIKEAIEHKEIPLNRVIAQTQQLGALRPIASVTMTAATQGLEMIPHWEVVEMQARKQSWEDIKSELYMENIPLEFYLEMSKPMRIILNYSTEKFTGEMVAQLLANYQKVLLKLVDFPEASILSQFTKVLSHFRELI